MEESRSDILLISTADWDNPYWTNKQHMAVQFAKKGHRVFYVESQGLRMPTPTVKDLKRLWARLARGFRPPRQVREGIFVWSPLVLPLYRYAWVRSLNRLLLSIGLRFWCKAKGMRPKILWSYSPMTATLYELSPYPTIIYHAVDDVKVQPGVPFEVVARGEIEFGKRADLIFTTAPYLQAFYQRLNPRTYMFSNVADFDHFNAALNPTTRIPEDIDMLQRPIVGFVGAISSYKLDFQLIHSLAQSHPNWSFVLIGEVGEGDPLTDVSLLENIPNIHLLGGRPYVKLPGYLKAIDVALLPCLLNQYTRSMFPMKFFEYLASGRPVVSTRLPALSGYEDIAALCRNCDEFAAAIVTALDGNAPALALRLATAREHTYEVRLNRMWEKVTEMLDPASTERQRVG